MHRNGSDSTDTRPLSRHDLILILVLACVALLSAAILCIMQYGPGPEEAMARITLHGSIYGSYNLSEDRRIEIKTEKGRNVIMIKDGKVRMTEADCPDRICVRHRAISREHDDPIICLPHKLIIEIINDQAPDSNTGMIDGISR